MNEPPAREQYSLQATVGESPIRDGSGCTVDPIRLPLSDRLLVAINDWAGFFDQLDGQLIGRDGDTTAADEFVGQSFKLAHRLRSELKGRDVHLIHPLTGERIKIEPTG